MIESIMYFGIGFLLAALTVLVVAPLVHGRAVRLTVRRLEATIPLSMAEVQADKDLLRAEFAMSTRRLQTNVEHLKTSSASQLAQLGKKDDAINRLQIELGTLRGQLHATEEEFAVKTSAVLDAQGALSEKESELAKLMSERDLRSRIADSQKVEINALKTQVAALKNRLIAASNKAKAERDAVIFLPKDWPTTDRVKVPMDSSQSPPPNLRRHEGDVVSLVLRVPMDFLRTPPPNDQRHEGDTVPLVLKVPMDSTQIPPPNYQRRHEGDIVPLALKGTMDSSQGPLPNNQRRHEDDVVPLALKGPMDSSQSPPNDQWRHEDDVVPFVLKVPMDSSQGPLPNNQRRHEDDVVPFVLKAPMDSSQSPPPNDQRSHEDDVVPIVLKAPMDSSQGPTPNDQRHHENDVGPFVPKERPIEEAGSSGPARDSDAGRDVSDRCIGMAREASDCFAGLRAAEPSIRAFPRPSGFNNDQFASKRSSLGRRPFRALARLSIAFLIGVGGSSAWQFHGDEVMEMVRTWAPSPGWSSLLSATKSPPARAPAAAATSPELAPLEAIARDLAAVKRSVEQLTDKREQKARNIATRQGVEQDIKKKTSSAPLQTREKLTLWPETRPTTIAGWTLLEITNGEAVLEGPTGIWRATRGDIVPGVGRVESVVHWGSRWIVATSSGLISTP